MKNPNCDGSGPCVITGEVRVLPTSVTGESNAIVCEACFVREMLWRKIRNRELGEAYQFAIPDWKSLAIYGGAK